MNEVFLILAFLILLTIPQFLLRKAHQPLRTYIRLMAAFLLLALVWLFADTDKWAIKLVMIALVLSSVIKTIADYRRTHSS